MPNLVKKSQLWYIPERPESFTSRCAEVKIIRENAFEHKKEKPGLILIPGANRPSNNWVQDYKKKTYSHNLHVKVLEFVSLQFVLPWSQRFFLIFLGEKDQQQAAMRRQRVA